MTDLKSYFHDKYKGGEDFIENVILPIFGEDKYEDAYEEDVLDNNPELLRMAESIGISQVLRLGTINIPMNPTDVFDITVSNHVQMERNRVAIQTLVRRIMSTYSSAFMVFHYDDDTRWDWRFTFCSKQGSNKDTTDSKRYTFLFGPNQSCRTAADNFNKLADKRGDIELDDIIRAFDVEALSKEFFTKYKEQYEKFCNYVYDNKYDSSLFGEEFAIWEDKKIRDYVKKLLGRIVFLHFLQKKGWMGVPADKDWGDGDQQFMLHLFEKATARQKNNYLDSVLEPLFSNALDTDRTDQDDLFDTGVAGFRNVKIPYLNGGLFEKDELDLPKSVFPAEYFDGLFRFFYQYNFTIDENDPNDAQVGVDPEMLGRIFENLLEDNKDKGAFYTPKEIVQYMCKESLIAHLQTKITGPDEHKQKLRDFVETHDVEALEDIVVEWEDGTEDTLANHIDNCLKEVKICDPAIGSGAFPMGLLKEIFYCRMTIEKFTDAAEIKKHIIQQNIYGVDIEKGAVDIARLRFWLALIVDEQTPHALPNMDFKIMQGNSLLEQYKGVDLSDIYDPQKLQLVIAFDEETQAKTLLQEHIFKYFHTTDHSERKSLIASINTAVQSLVKAKTYGNPRIGKNLSSIDFKNNTDFFLWHTWFHDVFEEGGFDIVIGNPPYIQLQSMLDMSTVYKDAQYATYNKSGDIYCLFVEQGFNLLSENGVLTYIMPNKWMQAGYGLQLREYLANKRILNIVDFGDVQLFENATTYTCIPLLQQAKPCKTFTASYMRSANISTIQDYSNTFNTKDFGKDAWVLSSSGELKLLNKLKKKYPTLKTYSKGEAYRGVLSGLSEAFLIGADRCNDLVRKSNRASQKIVPFLLGRDIKPYASPKPNKYMILFEKGFTKLHYGNGLQEETAWNYLQEDYPSITNWLEPFTVKGRKRGDKGDYWWELRACDYYDEFAKPKIMYQAFQVKPNFIYDETGCYCNNSMWILPTDNKALLGLLNSKMGWWLISKFCSQIQNGYQLIWKYFGQIPVALDEKKQQPIIALVDNVLAAKKSNPHADTSTLETEIDRLVYDLYGLTEDEIKMVEGKNQ